MHEVGHTLGLRHNFRSSRVYTRSSSPTRRSRATNGITGSVMEYAPVNLARPASRARLRHAVQDTLGPYDYWAIEYAYKPLDGRRAEEKPALEKIAARSAEPQLAYGTDEDNFLGIDPESLQFDLGNDAVALRQEADRDRAATCSSARRRAQLRPDQDYTVLRRSVSYAIARRRPRGRRAGAPDRRRAHAARRAGHRPRSARAGAGGRAARGARRHHRQPALRRQPARLAGAAAQARARLQRALATRCRRRRGLVATDYSLVRAGARPAARAARPADERHGRDAPPRQQREGAGRRRPRSCACPSSTAACRRRSGASSTAAATSRRCAASCSATTSTASRRCCSARAPRAAPTRAASCAPRRKIAARADPTRAGHRGGLSEEARAHLQTAPTRWSRRCRRGCSAPASDAHRRSRPRFRSLRRTGGAGGARRRAIVRRMTSASARRARPAAPCPHEIVGALTWSAAVVAALASRC